MSRMSESSNYSRKIRKRMASEINKTLLNRNSEVNFNVRDNTDWWIGLDPEETTFPGKRNNKLSGNQSDILKKNKSLTDQSALVISSQPRWWENLPTEVTVPLNTVLRESSPQPLEDEHTIVIPSIKTRRKKHSQNEANDSTNPFSNLLQTITTLTHTKVSSYTSVSNSISEKSADVSIKTPEVRNRQKRLHNQVDNSTNVFTDLIKSNVTSKHSEALSKQDEEDVSVSTPIIKKRQKRDRRSSGSIKIFTELISTPTSNKSISHKGDISDSSIATPEIKQRPMKKNSFTGKSQDLSDILSIKKKKIYDSKTSVSSGTNPFVFNDYSDSESNNLQENDNRESNDEVVHAQTDEEKESSDDELVKSNMKKNAIVKIHMGKVSNESDGTQQIPKTTENDELDVEQGVNLSIHLNKDRTAENIEGNIVVQSNLLLPLTETESVKKHTVLAHSTKIHRLSAPYSSESFSVSSIRDISDVKPGNQSKSISQQADIKNSNQNVNASDIYNNELLTKEQMAQEKNLSGVITDKYTNVISLPSVNEKRNSKRSFRNLSSSSITNKINSENLKKSEFEMNPPEKELDLGPEVNLIQSDRARKIGIEQTTNINKKGHFLKNTSADELIQSKKQFNEDHLSPTDHSNKFNTTPIKTNDSYKIQTRSSVNKSQDPKPDSELLEGNKNRDSNLKLKVDNVKRKLVQSPRTELENVSMSIDNTYNISTEFQSLSGVQTPMKETPHVSPVSIEKNIKKNISIKYNSLDRIQTRSFVKKTSDINDDAVHLKNIITPTKMSLDKIQTFSPIIKSSDVNEGLEYLESSATRKSNLKHDKNNTKNKNTALESNSEQLESSLFINKEEKTPDKFSTPKSYRTIQTRSSVKKSLEAGSNTEHFESGVARKLNFKDTENKSNMSQPNDSQLKNSPVANKKNISPEKFYNTPTKLKNDNMVQTRASLKRNPSIKTDFETITSSDNRLKTHSSVTSDKNLNTIQMDLFAKQYENSDGNQNISIKNVPNDVNPMHSKCISTVVDGRENMSNENNFQQHSHLRQSNDINEGVSNLNNNSAMVDNITDDQSKTNQKVKKIQSKTVQNYASNTSHQNYIDKNIDATASKTELNEENKLSMLKQLEKTQLSTSDSQKITKSSFKNKSKKVTDETRTMQENKNSLHATSSKISNLENGSAVNKDDSVLKSKKSINNILSNVGKNTTHDKTNSKKISIDNPKNSETNNVETEPSNRNNLEENSSDNTSLTYSKFENINLQGRRSYNANIRSTPLIKILNKDVVDAKSQHVNVDQNLYSMHSSNRKKTIFSYFDKSDKVEEQKLRNNLKEKKIDKKSTGDTVEKDDLRKDKEHVSNSKTIQSDGKRDRNTDKNFVEEALPEQVGSDTAPVNKITDQRAHIIIGDQRRQTNKHNFDQTEPGNVKNLNQKSNSNQNFRKIFTSVADLDSDSEESSWWQENATDSKNIDNISKNDIQVMKEDESSYKKDLNKSNPDATKINQEKVGNMNEKKQMNIDQYLQKQSKTQPFISKKKKSTFDPEKEKVLKQLREIKTIDGKLYSRRKSNLGIWVNKGLFNYIEKEFKIIYKDNFRKYTEKLLISVCNLVKQIDEAKDGKKLIDALKLELASSHLVKTHYDFYVFVQEYFPADIVEKIIPCIKPRSSRPTVHFNTKILFNNIID